LIWIKVQRKKTAAPVAAPAPLQRMTQRKTKCRLDSTRLDQAPRESPGEVTADT